MRIAPHALLIGGNALALVLLAGCPPTLSAPRGEAHLDAMAEASRHHAHGRDEEAIASWDEAARTAERRVDRDEAEWRAALELRRAGRLDEARARFDAIAARRPISRRTVRARFEVGRILLEQGARDEALAVLRDLCLSHPGDGPASRALAIVVGELEERDPAALESFLRELDERVASTDLHDDALTHLAELLRRRGDREGARAAYERIVTLHPYPHGQRWDDTFMRLADMAEEDGDPRAAIRYLERMIEVHAHGIRPGSYTLPLMPEAATRMAHLWRDALGDWERAAAVYRAAYDRFDTSRSRDDWLVELGELLVAHDRQAEGCETLRRATREFDAGSAVRRAREVLASACASSSE